MMHTIKRDLPTHSIYWLVFVTETEHFLQSRNGLLINIWTNLVLIKGKQKKTDNTAHQIPNRDRLAAVP
jgi:hypothetical protein